MRDQNKPISGGAVCANCRRSQPDRDFLQAVVAAIIRRLVAQRVTEGYRGGSERIGPFASSPTASRQL